MMAAEESTPARSGALLFRIVAPHQHRAVLGDRVFSCEREARLSNGRISVRWSAFEDNILIQANCPTLNDAKKACRARAAGYQLPVVNPLNPPAS